MQVKNINLSSTHEHSSGEKRLTKIVFGSTKRNLRNQGERTQSTNTNDINCQNLSNRINQLQTTIDNVKLVTPPYRMPPQPTGGNMTAYGEPQIPGATSIDTPSTSHFSTSTPLRTHSSKFPIERELVITNGDKGSTKIPLMSDRSGMHILQRQTGTVAPDHPPKPLHQAWNSQSQSSQQQQQLHNDTIQSTLTGAIPRTPARLPEDVTALAERENNKDRDSKESKNAVTKTYHTLKDLFSAKFKKDSNETNDELNNVVTQQQNQANAQESEELRSPYSALPVHMRQMQQPLNQSQPNIWNGNGSNSNGAITKINSSMDSANQNNANHQDYTTDLTSRIAQQRAASQPQLNVSFDRRGSQILLDTTERRGSLANIDVTDSDDGGFASHNRRQQIIHQSNFQHQMQQQQQQPQPHQFHQHQYQQQLQQHQLQSGQYLPQSSAHRHSPYVFQNNQTHTETSIIVTPAPYTSHNHQQQHHLHQPQLQHQPLVQHYSSPYQRAPSPKTIQNHQAHVQQHQSLQQQIRQDVLRASFQKQQQLNFQQISTVEINTNASEAEATSNIHQSTVVTTATATPSSSSSLPKNQPTRNEIKPKQMPSSAASSDYDKSGNHSSNVDSGRGSAAYSSGRKAPVDTSPENSDSPVVRPKENDTEWADMVDVELRNILEPCMQNMSIRPESTVSGSVSSITPPLPPTSPDGNTKIKSSQTKETSKPEYGLDTYNRASRTAGPIGPSRAGWPGSSVQKTFVSRSAAKKQEQSLLKRHLFGLDNDQTSTTTRSLDLDSLLGGHWGAEQSVSDSETDTQGLRHIRSQLEGLEHMYSEVLRMLGSRMPNGRTNETPLRSGRKRHGSLSSLPSSSVSSRPIRDYRRRNDDRKKVRDLKSINKRFQRLESHVVTLARSVAHLSSEMRSQHLITQELERLRDDLTTLRNQAIRSQTLFGPSGFDPEPPNLTNPKRVKKLQKFFGEDPPLIRLFLKKLGYEKYAPLFEAERVGMVELPYLGEERLQKLGVPLGPRLRILQEAQISLCKDTTLCIV